MPSLQSKTDPALERAAAIGQDLAGETVLGVMQITGGGNNGVYRLDCAGGTYALKLYRRDADNPRDRLAVEVAAHAFFARHGVGPVAEIIASDAQAGAALFPWIEGNRITEPGEADLDAAMEFIGTLKSLTRLADARALPRASEACLSMAELATQISHRHARLIQIIDSELNHFLEGVFAPAAAAMIPASLPDTDLAPDLQTLSPSDFGFHNALKSANGRITFLDFEYFGWDDPVKLAADTILHPGMNLRPDRALSAARGFRVIFADDVDFNRRLSQSLPLYGLRWCMILLNVYLRNGGVIDQQKRAQLAKAKAMLSRAQTLNEEDVYGA